MVFCFLCREVGTYKKVEYDSRRIYLQVHSTSVSDVIFLLLDLWMTSRKQAPAEYVLAVHGSATEPIGLDDTDVNGPGFLPADTGVATGGPLGTLYAERRPASLDDAAHAAIISFNTLDILHPPLTLAFGEFGMRTMDLRCANDLVESFLNTTFHPFSVESMIPIILNREDLEPSCISNDATLGPDAPPLTLSNLGKQRKKIIVCRGTKRIWAVQQIMLTLNKKLHDLRTSLASLKREHTGTGSLTWVDYHLAKVLGEIKAIKKQKVKFKTWGVVVYDSGEYPWMCVCLYEF
jgi:hypothetical protein